MHRGEARPKLLGSCRKGTEAGTGENSGRIRIYLLIALNRRKPVGSFNSSPGGVFAAIGPVGNLSSAPLSAMLTLIVGAPLALRTPQPVSTRRDALIAASGLAASASVLPAYAGLPFDPIGAYGKIGPGPMGPPPRVKGQPNSGILLLREVFDGALPEEGLLAWYEEHLAADFTATFAGGKVVLDRQASPPPPPGGAT